MTFFACPFFVQEKKPRRDLVGRRRRFSECVVDAVIMLCIGVIPVDKPSLLTCCLLLALNNKTTEISTQGARTHIEARSSCKAKMGNTNGRHMHGEYEISYGYSSARRMLTNTVTIIDRIAQENIRLETQLFLE